MPTGEQTEKEKLTQIYVHQKGELVGSAITNMSKLEILTDIRKSRSEPITWLDSSFADMSKSNKILDIVTNIILNNKLEALNF